MRLLCLGLTRTGTTTLSIALSKLGYTPYHGSESITCNFFNPTPEVTPRYEREEFDRLLGPYDAVLDIPASLFWEDLYQAYPDAKVILTTRDPETWWVSMDATLFGFMRSPFFRVWRHCDGRVIGPLFRMLELSWRVFCGNCYDKEVCQARFVEHYERVREAVPAEKLLELRLGRDGWDELCGFLGVPVPGEKWPWAYETRAFREHVNAAFWGAMRRIGAFIENRV
ncbi:P-loop containing nucleoside triphosphate hydrolase protein [Aspergillus avenaceus]|uniref:P-loop containing nucleoside triphosphate hydrolase protein n=1 Tax=Aspergillus avenaceus TaxID=36643 RepID=A0A5N6TEF1_ASPAV|nr:P-loop containing nucleoside triphosphate hydrolase protein [Aspergillus avenaceus]